MGGWGGCGGGWEGGEDWGEDGGMRVKGRWNTYIHTIRLK